MAALIADGWWRRNRSRHTVSCKKEYEDINLPLFAKIRKKIERCNHKADKCFKKNPKCF
jgi:hypothetical protein